MRILLASMFGLYTAMYAGSVWFEPAAEAPSLMEAKLPDNLAHFPPRRGEYKCVIIDTHDSDTTTIGVIVPVIIRLRGCNGIELKAQNGGQARLAFMKLLPMPVPLSTVHLFGPDKYGRTVGDFRTEGGFWASDKMIEGGWAERMK